MKTNAMRILDAHKIHYLTGEDIAKILNENPAKCFKTLITEGKPHEFYAFLVPVNKELDLKKAASSVNEKSVSMIPFKDLLKVTGYIMKKNYKVTIDESAKNFEDIYLSGGKVGLQLKVKLSDLIDVISPSFSPLTR